MTGEQTTTFSIDELCCAEEERLIRKRLGQMSGLTDIRCNVVSRTVTARHSCSQEEIVRALHDVGFTARLHHELHEPKNLWQKFHRQISTFGSGGFFLLGLVLHFLAISEAVTIPLFALSIVTGGWYIALKAIRSARHVNLDMNVLMTIAVMGAMAIGKWEEGAAVIFLFSLAQLLEYYSMERSRRAIRSLMELSPPTARVVRDEREQIVDVESVTIGERVAIRPGERIPLDGIVVGGESTVNQAPITGESIPVHKLAGNEVYAGSLNERGMLEIEVKKLYTNTLLARIVRMVEEAQAQRAPVQSFADRFARYYTPAVLAMAVLVALIGPFATNQPFGDWFYRALVLLVIACPCALVISTPVTIVSGLAHAARRGVLLKGGRHLEEIGRVSAIAFDKTGTLTVGTPRVTDVVPLDSLSQKEILRLAATVEAKSEHRLASAVLARALEENLTIDNVTYERFEALTGRGVTARINGTTYLLGSHALIEEKNLCSPQLESLLQKLEQQGKTTVILGTEHEALGVIAIADAIRPESRGVVSELHNCGIRKVVMLTGDNEGTARSIASRTGIDEFYSGVLPEEKASRMRLLKNRYGKVAMVGDGINDAPALAESTVGIAMGGSGADIALETADIVLMSDELSRLPEIMRLSKKTLSLIKQNIVIALVTKMAVLGLGVAGFATLWMAVLADDGATLIVLLNGLRALMPLKN